MVPHLLPISRKKATVEAHKAQIFYLLVASHHHSLVIAALVWAGLPVHLSIICSKQCICQFMKQTIRNTLGSY
jgi:hypothetical protein